MSPYPLFYESFARILGIISMLSNRDNARTGIVTTQVLFEKKGITENLYIILCLYYNIFPKSFPI